jgi:hypothetical protein
MKKELNELKALIEKAKKAHDTSFDESLDDDTTDAAYAEYWTLLNRIADVLYSMTGGKIDRNTGLKMAAHKADKIMDLLNKAA